MTPETKRQLAALLAIGCDIEKSADFCGVVVADLLSELETDVAWQYDLKRAVAGFEIQHLQKLQAASRDEKNWKLSQWWLEGRWPDRYARKADVVTTSELTKFVATIGEILGDEITDNELRDRVLAKLAATEI